MDLHRIYKKLGEMIIEGNSMEELTEYLLENLDKVMTEFERYAYYSRKHKGMLAVSLCLFRYHFSNEPNIFFLISISGVVYRILWVWGRSYTRIINWFRDQQKITETEIREIWKDGWS